MSLSVLLAFGGLPPHVKTDSCGNTRTPSPSLRRLESISNAADYLSVSTKTIRRYIASGRVTAYQTGPKLIRVDRSELERLLQPIPTGGDQHDRQAKRPGCRIPGRLTNQRPPDRSADSHLTALDSLAEVIDGTFVLVVQVTGGKYRRRCFLSVKAAENAVRRATELGETATVYLAELRPLWKVRGGAA